MNAKVKHIDPRIKEAVYVAATAVTFYQVARYFKMEVGLALALSSAVSQILLIDNKKNTNP